ncbi:MAG: rhomboid family intramembrane serine protease [Desulfocapsaceae bacterium]|nr:rhomboid family intramembrane serine protease [Desulfocapsaceae bacterium]
MFLPIGDTPNPDRFTPFITWGLIAVNVAVYLFISLPLSIKLPEAATPGILEFINMLASRGYTMEQIRIILGQTSLNDVLLYQYGYKPAAPSLIDLFSSMFLHGGLMHLAGNMLFLYIYGDNVEHQLGRLKFLLMYLFTGAIATLSFAFLAGNSMTPLVGASGAISGVLGFYFFMFPRNQVKVLLVLFPIYLGVVQIPARIVLAIYVIIDNFLPVLLQAGGNVAYGAHLGGFFAGLGVAVLGEYFEWQLPFRKDRKITPRYKAKPAATAGSWNGQPPSKLKQALSDNDIDALIDALQKAEAAELQGLSVDDITACARLLVEHDHLTPATKLLKIGLAIHKQSSFCAELYLELGRIRLLQGYTTAAYQHLLTALDLNTSSSTETRIRQLLKQIEA